MWVDMGERRYWDSDGGKDIGENHILIEEKREKIGTSYNHKA